MAYKEAVFHSPIFSMFLLFIGFLISHNDVETYYINIYHFNKKIYGTRLSFSPLSSDSSPVIQTCYYSQQRLEPMEPYKTGNIKKLNQSTCSIDGQGEYKDSIS